MSKPNNLESLWMPFTPNKTFKKDPRIIVKAKDMHFTSDDNRQILDGTAGLWCVNAGHGRKKIQEAVTQQIEELDYSPPFQFGQDCTCVSTSTRSLLKNKIDWPRAWLSRCWLWWY